MCCQITCLKTESVTLVVKRESSPGSHVQVTVLSEGFIKQLRLVGGDGGSAIHISDNHLLTKMDVIIKNTQIQQSNLLCSLFRLK